VVAAFVGVASSPIGSYAVRTVTAGLAAALLLRPPCSRGQDRASHPVRGGGERRGARSRSSRVGQLLLAGALLVGVASGLLAAVQTLASGHAPVGGAAALLYLGHAPLSVAGLLCLPRVRTDHGGRLRVLADVAVGERRSLIGAEQIDAKCATFRTSGTTQPRRCWAPVSVFCPRPQSRRALRAHRGLGRPWPKVGCRRRTMRAPTVPLWGAPITAHSARARSRRPCPGRGCPPLPALRPAATEGRPRGSSPVDESRSSPCEG
jgi:hypothetical protein